MNSNPEYSIVIPVYNTEQSLIDLTERINTVFRETIKSTYEIIFIDDCSKNPKTWPTLQSLVQKHNNLQAITLMRNFGQQAATICGIRLSQGQYVLTMDDDLQHLPEDIPALIALRQHDIIMGQFKTKQHSLAKRISSNIKGYFDKVILGKPKGIRLSSFRLLNRATINGILQFADTPYPFLPGMFFYVTRDIAGVFVTHGTRKEGETGYNFFKLVRMFSNLMINNSSFLLNVIGNIGLTISFFSFALGLYFVYLKVIHSTTIVGWTSVIVAVLFIGGLLLFSIGIIGEYLIRIIRGVDKRPNYIIRQHLKK